MSGGLRFCLWATHTLSAAHSSGRLNWPSPLMEEMKVSYFPPLRKQYKVHRDVGDISPHPSGQFVLRLAGRRARCRPCVFLLSPPADTLVESQLVARCLWLHLRPSDGASPTLTKLWLPPPLWILLPAQAVMYGSKTCLEYPL